jgi:hypothetical protein
MKYHLMLRKTVLAVNHCCIKDSSLFSFPMAPRSQLIVAVENVRLLQC